MFRPDDIDNFNNDVKKWTDDTKQDALNELDALGVQASSQSNSPIPLRQALRATVSKKNTISSRISFRFPRHAVFLHKGVGRGTSAAQVGSTIRKAKPWLNPPIDKNLDNLAGLVADHQGTMIVNALIIK